MRSTRTPARAAPARPAHGDRRWLGPAVALFVVAAMWIHAASYLPFLADDALISLRYSARLLQGHGLTWSDGPPVEGYSNLLWVLLCAGLGGLGLDLIHAARALGFTTAGLALLAVLYVHRPTAPAGALPALAGALAMALAGPLAVWSVGGLEQPLLAGLLAWALAHGMLEARWVSAGVLLGLLCWTRVDGVVLAAGACAGGLLASGLSRDSLLRCARLALIPAAATLVQQAFRLSYYGEWLPNSALAKVAFSGRRLHEGLHYVGSGLLGLAALSLPALALGALVARHGERGRRVRFLAAPLVLWCAYVVVVGGDSFPAYRHLVPVVVILGLLFAEGLGAFVERGPRALKLAWAATPVLLVVLGFMQAADSQNQRAEKERWEWDGQVIGQLLGRAFGERRALLAADPAGTLPYFSGLPAIDMLGINDHFLARHRPKDFGRGFLGHELGNGGYVLDREPDLVVFCGPGGSPRPCFRSGKEMVSDPRFRERYRPVTFEGDDPYEFKSLVWVRFEGGVTGIVREAGRVVVPGYLLIANRRSVAGLGPADRPGVIVAPDVPAGILGLRLRPGWWRAQLLHDGDPPRIEVRPAGGGPVLASGVVGVEFELAGGGPPAVDLRVSVERGTHARVREVLFDFLAGARQPVAGWQTPGLETLSSALTLLECGTAGSSPPGWAEQGLGWRRSGRKPTGAAG